MRIFSVKLAPGLRVSASSRGLRTHVGPRLARVHVGGGRTGISTGAGPFTYYTSGSSQRPSGASPAAIRATSPIPQAQSKAEEAHSLAQEIQTILDLHRVQFTPASRPQASPPPAPNSRSIRAKYRRFARDSTSLFARAERRSALSEADRRAQHESEAIAQEWKGQQTAWQRELDDQWEGLMRNEPDTVLGVLAVALEDNEAYAAAVGVDGDEVSIVVLLPEVEVLPERKPGVTAAGNLSLKKFTKTEAAELYKELVAGHLLTTVQEALAVAPAVQVVRVVGVRRTTKGRVDALVAARLSRAALAAAAWSTASATEILNGAQTELVVNQKGVTKALHALDLRHEPGLQALVDAVEFDS
ncbi:hypothetical protein GCM10009623_26570 [Nocardioides aestuarii]